MKRPTRTRQPLPSGLEQMVQRVDTDATLAGVALPPAQQEALRAAGRSVPADTGGIALVAGSDSTARAKAAGLLASARGADLYRVELDQVVSKYIGETEKNLDRLFDLAARADVVLYFDEADALFGKRTDVKDAHDRYANLDVSSLLQRIEKFDGLIILASNRKAALDDAFIRRLRYVVDLPSV